MNPFGTRGAAQFADALDGTTALALPGLTLAARLRAVGASLDEAVVPRAEFRDALRMRLLAVATVQTAVQTAAPAFADAQAVAPVASAVSWRRRTGAATAGAMASVVAVSGVAVAGSQSLPGDPFYGVKKTAEAFQLRTADGDVEKGTQHLEFAATRLREVRGLTLGRDAADAGPELGPVALDGGITLRSATQPLAAGEALSSAVAARVKATLAEMDEQTRDGSELLNEAFRESRTTKPLRVLDTFATRQAAGLEQLLPALPPRTQDRARISLALLVEVVETTNDLLDMTACTAGCDPVAAAPSLPGAPTAPTGSTQGPCACATPAPAPAPGPSAPTTEEPAEPVEPAEEPAEEPTTAASPEPSSPSPSPSPSSGGLPAPLPPLPLPPLPPLPVPVPTLTLAPLTPAAPAAAQVLPGTTSKSSSDSAPAPAEPAVPEPLPQLAPLPPRP